MARKIELNETEIVIHFTGLTSAAALQRKLIIPYQSITKVTIEDYQPSWLAFRIGTAIPGFDIYEGKFYKSGEWHFLSYENRDKVITIDLEGHDYKKVVFEVENPEETQKAIIQKCSQLS